MLCTQAELSSLAVAPKVKVPSPAAPLRATATLMSEHLHALADADAVAAAAATAPLEVPALRLAACAAARVGREHARLGQVGIKAGFGTVWSCAVKLWHKHVACIMHCDLGWLRR